MLTGVGFIINIDIWPDDCPYNHFFLVYRYGDTVAEVDGRTYPQKPDVVEQYGVRVFGP